MLHWTCWEFGNFSFHLRKVRIWFFSAARNTKNQLQLINSNDLNISPHFESKKFCKFIRKRIISLLSISSLSKWRRNSNFYFQMSQSVIWWKGNWAIFAIDFSSTRNFSNNHLWEFFLFEKFFHPRNRVATSLLFRRPEKKIRKRNFCSKFY